MGSRKGLTWRAGGIRPARLLLACLGVLAAACADASDLAPLDPKVRMTTVRAADIAPGAAAEGRYFDRTVPGAVHQFAVAGDEPANGGAWRAYAEKRRLRYTLWRPGDGPADRVLAAAGLAPAVARLTAAGLQTCVLDALRYAVLAAEGGIAVGPSLRVPRADGEEVALEEVVPGRGLVLTTTKLGRNIGREVAAFVSTELIMSAPAHPVMAHVVASLPDNVAGWPAPLAAVDRDYLTGDVFFNLALGGTYRIIPHTSCEALGMFEAGVVTIDPALHPRLDAHMRGATTHAAGRLVGDPSLRRSPASDAPIPRRVHQIWFGDPARRPAGVMAEWQAACAEHGYAYRLWSEDDLDEIRAMVPAANQEILERRRRQRGYQGVADVLRLSILETHGGAYVDCDFHPPVGPEGAALALDEVLPHRGLVVASEHFSRSVRTSSLFAQNGIIMAPAGHPVIAFAVAHLAGHVRELDRRGRAHLDALATGPFFLNRCLDGGFSLLPTAYYHQLGMD